MKLNPAGDQANANNWQVKIKKKINYIATEQQDSAPVRLVFSFLIGNRAFSSTDNGSGSSSALSFDVFWWCVCANLIAF